MAQEVDQFCTSLCENNCCCRTIYTDGITTAHNLSPVPALNQGQRDR